MTTVTDDCDGKGTFNFPLSKIERGFSNVHKRNSYPENFTVKKGGIMNKGTFIHTHENEESHNENETDPVCSGNATDELFFDDFWYVDKFAGALFSIALVVILWLRI